MADDRRLAFLRELERADEEVSAALAELDELARETEDVRERALELQAFLTRLPVERERLARERTEAEGGVEASREALALADRELASAEDENDRERVAAARRARVRAADLLRVAERRAADVRTREERLERRADEAGRESAELEERARAVARALRGRPRLAEDAGSHPGPGLGGVSAWAGRARAALFVARSGLASERDAVLRQANELASVVLGEPLTAASASVVARRVERALGA